MLIVYEDILSFAQNHYHHILLLFQYFSTKMITKTAKMRIILAVFSFFLFGLIFSTSFDKSKISL